MAENSSAMSSLDKFYIAFEAMIGVSAAVGNALVICVVRLNPAFQNNTFYFIVSLALADIAMGLLVMPLAIVINLGIVMHFYFCLFLCCLLMVFSHASILSLLAIAIDRFLRVKLPTRYKTVTTRRRIWMALGSCWLVSLLVGCVPMFGWNQKVPGSPSSMVCHYPAVMRMDYVVYFSFFSWILIPLIIMCVLYVGIFYIIHTKLSPNVTISKTTGVFYGKEFKTAKSLALVLFLFAVSWLPLCILNCISYFCRDCKIPLPLLYLGILLSHANSAMNPIVYACRIKKFKETYIFVLKTYILRMNPDPLVPTVEYTSEQMSLSQI
ncbi:adenosine receptor A3-like isoform X1 [Alligator sinensis]|uniref:Adenosine receptor A3 n=1 Tax=Alligator sinensis TaxID=38654 RepID=A0A1U7S6Z4_ALLSI|nr:adenosine receptor A3-like isoform X1 [Alligator sinensis]